MTNTAGHSAQCAALPNWEGQFRTLCLVEVDINLENLRLLQVVDFKTLSHPISSPALCPNPSVTRNSPHNPAMVAQSLSSLLQRATIDDHEEVLQSCNEALAKSKSDMQAQHIKVIALLKLDRYEDALRVLETGGDSLKKRAGFEHAYALYKCSKLEEALQAATQAAVSRGASHLEAQVVRQSLLTILNMR